MFLRGVALPLRGDPTHTVALGATIWDQTPNSAPWSLTMPATVGSNFLNVTKYFTETHTGIKIKANARAAQLRDQRRGGNAVSSKGRRRNRSERAQKPTGCSDPHRAASVEDRQRLAAMTPPRREVDSRAPLRSAAAHGSLPVALEGTLRTARGEGGRRGRLGASNFAGQLTNLEQTARVESVTTKRHHNTCFSQQRPTVYDNQNTLKISTSQNF